MKKIHTQSEQGFTLIELLVVLAIIALLASFIFTSLLRAQKKGRDTRRVEDVNTLMKAIQMYKVTHRKYPPAIADPSTQNCWVNDFQNLATSSNCWVEITESSNLISELHQDGALDNNKMIEDPLGSPYSYWYTHNTSRGDFAIRFCMETDEVAGFKNGCHNIMATNQEARGY